MARSAPGFISAATISREGLVVPVVVSAAARQGETSRKARAHRFLEIILCPYRVCLKKAYRKSGQIMNETRATLEGSARPRRRSQPRLGKRWHITRCVSVASLTSSLVLTLPSRYLPVEDDFAHLYAQTILDRSRSSNPG